MPAPGPVKRQRLSAYALVVRADAVLLTQLSGRSTREGAWTLPGGGIDHGEDPRAGLVREVYEETGLEAVPGRLLDLHSVHHEGVAPDGVLEDYHAIRVVFEATVVGDSSSPRVVEQDGTTVAAAWVPLRDINSGYVDTVDIVGLALDAAAAPSLISNAVQTFHTALGVPSAAGLDSKPASWEQRISLLREEFEEYVAAANDGDLVGVADALADMVYVIYGTALVYGIPIDAVLVEVHSANMTKAAGSSTGVFDPGKKARKPTGYRAPDIASLLARHQQQ